MPGDNVLSDLAERTLALVDIPSESNHEAARLRVREGHGRPAARPRRRRVARLRPPWREAAGAALGPHRHGPGSGQHPRPDRGRRSPRPRLDRHEGRARRDDRARGLGRRRGSRVRPRADLLPTRGARAEREPAAGGVRGDAGGRRVGARDLPRADRQHAPARLPREHQRPRRVRGPLGALGAAVARRQRDQARPGRVARRPRARAERRRHRRACLPRGRQRHADRRLRQRDQCHPGTCRGDAQLPLCADPDGRGGGGPAARARRKRARDHPGVASGARCSSLAARRGA